MNGMFNGAKAFNFDIAEWDVGKVTNMNEMFKNTRAFNQDLSPWNASKIPRQNCSVKTKEQTQEDTVNDMFKNASKMSGKFLWNRPLPGLCKDPVREQCTTRLRPLAKEVKRLRSVEAQLSHVFSSATSDSGDFVLNKTAYACAGNATYTSEPWKLIAANANEALAGRSPDDPLFLLYSLRAMQKCRKVLDCKYVTVGTDASYRLFKEDQCGTMVPSAKHRVYHRVSLPSVDDALASGTNLRTITKKLVKGRFVKLQKIFGQDKGTLAVAEVEVYGPDGESNLARGARVCDP